MPRPMKCRKVCCLPKTDEFVPVCKRGGAGTKERETVLINVDEYEVIRLIDNEGYSQEECGGYMKVARTTVQLMYHSARKKIAYALVNGFAIRIEGGDYRLCDGTEASCSCGGCEKHRHTKQANHSDSSKENL